MALANLQKRFWQAITAPNGLEQAVREFQKSDPSALPLTNWIRATNADIAYERLDVYANMYFFRLLEVLCGDYPKVLKLVGNVNFHNLIVHYLVAYPSTERSVRHVGRHLPEFLLGHSEARQWPYVSELALLEWTRSSAFDCADSAPITTEVFSGLEGEQFARLRFEFSPSLRLLRLSYPVHQTWIEFEQGNDAPKLAPHPTTLLIWRMGFNVYHKQLSSNEARLLELLRSGHLFGDACEELAEGVPDVQALAQELFGALRQWVVDGLIVRCETR